MEEVQSLPNNSEVLCAGTAPGATVGQLGSEGTLGPLGQKLPAPELYELGQSRHSRLTRAPGGAGPRCQSPGDRLHEHLINVTGTNAPRRKNIPSAQERSDVLYSRVRPGRNLPGNRTKALGGLIMIFSSSYSLASTEMPFLAHDELRASPNPPPWLVCL